jgi:hypothetical protein
MVGYFIDTHVNNYFEMVNVDSNIHTFKMIVPAGGLKNTWVGIEFYNMRMYPWFNSTGDESLSEYYNACNATTSKA